MILVNGNNLVLVLVKFINTIANQKSNYIHQTEFQSSFEQF